MNPKEMAAKIMASKKSKKVPPKKGGLMKAAMEACKKKSTG